MKKQIYIYSLILSFLLLFSPALFADEIDNKADDLGEIKETEESIEKNDDLVKSYIYTLNGNESKFHLVKVDMKDKKNYFDIEIADDKIGRARWLKTLSDKAAEKAPDSEVIAAVNAGFFSMGKVIKEPITTIIKNGEFDFIDSWGILMAFDGDNDISIIRDKFRILASVNGDFDEPYGFEVKYLNRNGRKDGDISILTSKYLHEIDNVKRNVIEVNDRRVVNIYDKVPKNIDSSSYLIVSSGKISGREIKIGDRIELSYKLYDKESKMHKNDFPSIKTAVGGAPVLVLDGKKVMDLRKDGLASWSPNKRRERSMIGITKDKVVYIVVSPDMSLNTLTNLAMKLDLDTAINLDGGGSSGLVVRNEYVQIPKRAVPNALILKRKNTEPIRISINGKEKFYVHEPYSLNGNAMLPLRKVLEDLDCDISWNKNSKEISFERYGKTYRVKNGSRMIRLKNSNYMMKEALVINDGVSYISIRDLIRAMGGEVTWIEDSKMIAIEIDSADEHYEMAKQALLEADFEKSKREFNKALSIYPKHIASLRGLADVYEKSYQKTRAKSYYQKILRVNSKHIPSLLYIAKNYEENNNSNMAIRQYKKVLEEDTYNMTSLKSLARIYEDKKNNKMAIEYYEKVYNKEDNLELANKLIAMYKKEIEKNKRDPKLYKKTAFIYDRYGNYAMSKKYFEGSYNLYKRDLEVVKKLAFLNENLNSRKAFQFYKEAYELKQDDFEVVKKLAKYYEKNDIKNAVNFYEKAYKLNSKDLFVISKLAELNYKQGYEKEALKYYAKQYEMEKDIDVLSVLLNFYQKTSQYDEGIKAFESMEFSDKTVFNPFIYLNVARMYDKKEDINKAYQNYKKYISYEGGSWYLVSSDLEEAKNYVSKVEKTIANTGVENVEENANEEGQAQDPPENQENQENPVDEEDGPLVDYDEDDDVEIIDDNSEENDDNDEIEIGE